MASARRSSKRSSRRARDASSSSAAAVAADARARAKETTDPAEITTLLQHSDSSVRLTALRQLCPCKLRSDASKTEFEPVWDRIFLMVHDDCPGVRAQVLHTICDGSPSSLEAEVAEALEVFNRDEDKAIRRTAHKVLAEYTRTGRWNVL